MFKIFGARNVALGHSILECLDYVLRIQTWSSMEQIAPALIHHLMEKTKAIEVITGHNNQGACKQWGYIRFQDEKDREASAPIIQDLISRRVLSRFIYSSDHGLFNECWRCGAM